MSAGHFFQVDGQVTSSLIYDNYHDSLTMLHQWYDEGLIYHDFYSNETHDILDPLLQFSNVTRLYLLDVVLPTVYDQTRELAAYSEKEQEAIAVWSDTKEARFTMPSVTLSTVENEELSQNLVDVETYASECIIKFIIGDLDLGQWDSFVSTMKDLGIERCIEIYQEALDAQ